MRAAVHVRYGGPEVVRIAEVPTPSPGPGELLIRVHATTVNRTDCAYRAAQPFLIRPMTGLVRPRRTVLGCEFAGEVAAVGADVTGFSVGERVYGYDERRMGGHAEYLVVPAEGWVRRIPDGIDYVHAAPSTEGSHYALAFLRVARIEEGQSVLVYGATGAIGSAAVQLLRSAGVRVTAVCGPDHLDLVRGLGAERAVDYTATDFTADPQRYDAVFDAVGKTTFGACRRLLTPRGAYVSSELGPRAQNLVLAAVAPATRGATVRFPFPRQDRDTIDLIHDRIAAGELRPVIDRVYPFHRIVEAHRYVDSGQKVGNVVIALSGGPE